MNRNFSTFDVRNIYRCSRGISYTKRIDSASAHRYRSAPRRRNGFFSQTLTNEDSSHA